MQPGQAHRPEDRNKDASSGASLGVDQTPQASRE
jgi:hypothetical protein